MLHHRISRRGRLLRVLNEHYVRDDISCGVTDCGFCGGTVTPAVLLSAEPANATVLVLDTNIVLHHMDALEAASTVFSDVVILQTVAAETRHRNLAVYGRLSALLRDSTRRFVYFANENHRDTFVVRRDAESPNDYNDRSVRVAALWYRQHIAPLGLQVTLITDDAACSKLASAEGLESMTMARFVAQNAAKHPGLSELLAKATPVADDDVDESRTSTTRQEVAANSAERRPGIAAASSKSSASKYTEHWNEAKLLSAVKAQQAFQGTLRVNKECWFEARVAVHNTGGRASMEAQEVTGGDDMVSVLVSGRDAINRAMEGDTVVIELLPLDQWRRPSSSLIVQADTAAAEEVEVSAAEASVREGSWIIIPCSKHSISALVRASCRCPAIRVALRASDRACHRQRALPCICCDGQQPRRSPERKSHPLLVLWVF
jgi:exosome complex exonuclease DIS3/RRP44